MMQEIRFTEEIRQQTSPAHQELERSIVKIIRQINSPGDYEKMLVFFYGYYKPLEDLIHQHLDYESFLFQTRQSDWLISDISQLGNHTMEIPVCTNLPQIKNQLQALAALYVLEGSTLGGIHILNMIRKRIHLADGYADRFFNGHGVHTTSNWNRFKELIDAAVSIPYRVLFLHAVNDTFFQFKSWAELNYTYEQQEKL